MENKFDPINITKLCTDVTLVKPVTKHIMIGDGLTKEDDAIAADIKGLAHLLDE